MVLTTHCMRCGADLRKASFTMSRFNTDMICSACEAAERKHPLYEKARAAEEAEVERHNYNFPGIGCPSELYRRRVPGNFSGAEVIKAAIEGPASVGAVGCDHCNGYGSSLKEEAETCTKCGGTGLLRKETP